jgi:hypothetical protein
MHRPPQQPGPPQRRHPAGSFQPQNSLGQPPYTVYAQQPSGRDPAYPRTPQGGPDQPHRPPRRTRSTGLLVTVVIVAALLLAGAVTFTLTTRTDGDPSAADATAPAPGAGSDDPDSARGTAERAVESLNAKDFAALNALACAGTDKERALPNPEVFQGIEFEAALEDVDENGESATARIRVTAFGRSEVAPPLHLMKDGSTWCIGTMNP